MPEDPPVIFFDSIEAWAVSAGIGHLEIAATLVAPGSKPAKAMKVSVARLRFPLAIVPALKRAIEKIETVAKAHGQTDATDAGKALN